MPILASTRRRCAISTLVAGTCVALVMHGAGGDLAPHLPAAPLFHVSAGMGAAFAGLILADGFGHSRWTGQLLAVVAAIAATLLGAMTGAAVALSITAFFDANAAIVDVIEAAPLFGFIAIADGLTTSVPVAVTWAVSMTAVHVSMLRLRRAINVARALST